MTKKETVVTIGKLVFVVAPEPAPKPKPKRTRRRAPAPQCTPNRSYQSASVPCSDGIYRMKHLAERFERKKKRGRFERWFLNSWDE